MTIELSSRISTWWSVLNRKLRDDSGLSHTTETLIILGVVAGVAIVVGVFFRNYVAELIAAIPHP